MSACFPQLFPHGSGMSHLTLFVLSSRVVPVSSSPLLREPISPSLLLLEPVSPSPRWSL